MMVPPENNISYCIRGLDQPAESAIDSVAWLALPRNYCQFNGLTQISFFGDRQKEGSIAGPDRLQVSDDWVS
jgi:hypothetical protein